jgi:hypothetical protein
MALMSLPLRTRARADSLIPVAIFLSSGLPGVLLLTGFAPELLLPLSKGDPQMVSVLEGATDLRLALCTINTPVRPIDDPPPVFLYIIRVSCPDCQKKSKLDDVVPSSYTPSSFQPNQRLQVTGASRWPEANVTFSNCHQTLLVTDSIWFPSAAIRLKL